MSEESEVFENYLKIIKAKKEEQDPYKPKSVGNVKDITKLYYGNNNDFLEYEKCIMEVAHPNKVIITPAYDPINALVENNIERQKIMLNIVRKQPTGNSTYQKYAEDKDELLLSLIKTANELDCQDKDNLRKIADHCMLDLKKKDNITKTALGPWAIGVIVGGVAGLIGLLYAQQHLAKSSQGLEINYKSLISELDDLIEETTFTNGSGVTMGLKGVEYLDSFVQSAKDLKDRVNKVYKECKKVEKIINYLDKPRSASEAIEMAKQEEAKNIPLVYQMFEKIYEEHNSYFEDVVKKFSNEEFKLRQIKDKGLLDKLFSQTGMVGGKGLLSDDFDDVRRSLQAFQKSFSDFLLVLKAASDMKDKAAKDIQSATPSSQSAQKQEENKELKDDEFKKQLEDFSKKL